MPMIREMWKLTSSLVGANRHEDIAGFHRLEATLDEPRLEKILNYSLFTETLRSEERELLHTFTAALRENQYLHPVIARRARQLTSELSQLLETVDATFLLDGGNMFHFGEIQKTLPPMIGDWTICT